MSKRRPATSEEEKAPEDLTPEERRDQRRRDRTKAGKNRRGFGSPLRRGLLVGVPTAIIVVVILIVLYNPFNIGSPCLTLSTPTQPYFPPSTTTDFSQSWCPQGQPTVAFAVQPRLSLVVNGTSVGLPTGIGVNRSYANGYTCTLPVSTPTTAGAVPAGVFVISSPWTYSYSLEWFFQDWGITYHTVTIGKSPNRPVAYTKSNLFGFPADSSHAITLLVDGQLSNAGPNLDLSTLDYESGPFPSCIGSTYGTGHTIVLTYGSNAPVAGVHGLRAPTLETGTTLSGWELQGWYGPAPHFNFFPQLYGSAKDREVASFTFAFGRGVSG